MALTHEVFLRYRETLRLERFRAVFLGVITTAPETFLLLIAVQWFHAPPSVKALIASSVSIGLFLSPLSLTVMRALSLSPSQTSALLWSVSSFGFFLAAFSGTLTFFLIGCTFALALQSLATPLNTQTYQQNYPERRRGRAYAQSATIKIFTTIVCSYLFGILMAQSLDYYQELLFVYAVCAASSGWYLSRCSTVRIEDTDESKHILRGFRYVKSDTLFRNTLISWMLLGFANLMTLPLRVEYLGNPRYGLTLSPAEVALYVGVIPSAARLVLSPVWGIIFDHLNFSSTRVCINLCFAVGVFSFFVPDSPWALIIGAIAYGVGNAGGDIAWQLWVTKISVPERVHDYMAVHVFLTGFRGIIAPFVGFYMMNLTSPTTCAWSAVALIFVACLLLFRERENFALRVR